MLKLQVDHKKMIKCKHVLHQLQYKVFSIKLIQHGMIMYNQFIENIGDKKIHHIQVLSVVNVLLLLLLVNSCLLLVEPKLYMTKSWV